VGSRIGARSAALIGDDVPTPEPADGWVEVNGLRLHYLDWGGAGRPPVLFLHGGSAHAHWWDFAIPLLAERFRCIALDLRGHGESGRPANADYGLAAHAADVGAVVGALGLGGGGVVGHSFGGWVAMVYAGGAGTAVGALALLDSRPHIGVRSARMLEALRSCRTPATRATTTPSRASASCRPRRAPRPRWSPTSPPMASSARPTARISPASTAARSPVPAPRI
jgi:pimeloyl-ACP methyl ester carboxylesterase